MRLDETEPETVYERLKQYREEGAVGVGELAVNHRLDHPFLEAVFQAAEALGLPVLFHMSRRKASSTVWWMSRGCPFWNGL